MLGSGPTEPDNFSQWFCYGHGDPLFSSRREQDAVEHGRLHDGVCVAVCCLLVRDALAGVGGIRLRTPPNLLHPGLQQRGQVRARASSHGRGGWSCRPLGWPRQHTKPPSCPPPTLLLGQISLPSGWGEAGTTRGCLDLRGSMREQLKAASSVGEAGA